MKKLIPYILAYLIIATGTAAFYKPTHAFPVPPNSVTVFSTLSQGDLAAKLDQAGFHDQMMFKPAPLGSLIVHFLVFAAYFAAFAGLTLLFQRAFLRTPKSDNENEYETVHTIDEWLF
jgi:hypothetical protein